MTACNVRRVFLDQMSALSSSWRVKVQPLVKVGSASHNVIRVQLKVCVFEGHKDSVNIGYNYR